VVVTPFLYPDRDNIELFIQESPFGDGVLITDLGQTMMKLDEYGFVPGNAARRRAMINQIISSAGVRYEDGAVLTLAPPGDVGRRMWDVLLAVQRMSDLVFTVQNYTRATFTDEVEDYMASRSVEYQRGVRIELPTGYGFNADFVVRDRQVIQLLSASTQNYAIQRTARVYQDFSELRLAQDERRRLAVLDDRVPFWTDNTFVSLSHQVDRILRWSQRSDIERELTGAAA
jgi:hypothetical protein